MVSTFSKNLTLFFLLSLLSVLLMLLDHFSRISWLREETERAINPLKFALSQVVRSLPFSRTLEQDPVILQSKIDFLEGQKAHLRAEMKSLLEENEALRKQLRADQKVQVSLLPAKNLAVVEGVMTLDQGEKSGVKEDMVVVSEDILVGCIGAITPLASRVALPVKEGNRISVKILESGEKGFLKGTAEGRLVLEEILQRAELLADQIIVTSGEEGKYPPDLPIGKIEKVIKDDVQIYQKAEVKSLVDYQSLEVVMIRM